MTSAALTKTEAGRVARRFDRLSGGTGRLTWADFAGTDINTPAFRRVWEVLTAHDPDGELDLPSLVAALTGPARPGTPADRVAFLFALLDRDGDGRLARAELVAALPRTLPDPAAAADAALALHAADPASGLTQTEFTALLARAEGGGV
jgi:Ca2+-binding EF-hand superfamily protein